MNRTQKFALNSMTSMFSQIIVLIAGVIIPRLMISTYGSEINGLVSSLNQFISYITLVEAGIGGAAIYSLYKPLAEQDTLQISRVVAAARKSYRQAGVIFLTGIVILGVVYGLLSNAVTVSFKHIFVLTLILGINGCFDFFFIAGYKVLLTADQRNYVISSVVIFQTIFRTVIICILATRGINVLVLYGCVSSLVLINTIIIVYYCRHNYSYIDHNASPDKTAMRKRWDVIYQQILGIIQSGAPTVIATVLLNLITVSVYTVYNMVVSGLNGVLGIFITGLPAGFGDLIARKEYDNLKKTVSEFEVAYYFILSIVYGLAFVLIMPFISIYTYGLEDANYYYPALGIIIVLNGLLYNIKTPQSMLVVSAGMYRETRSRVTIQGLIIIICGTIGGKIAGIVGIMVGSCLSNLYRTIDLLFFTPRNITHASVKQSALRMIRVLMSIALICLPLLFHTPLVDNYIQWVFMAMVYGLWAVVVAVFNTYLFDRNEFVSLKKRTLNILKRKR